MAFYLSGKSPSLQDLTVPRGSRCPLMCLTCTWKVILLSFAVSDTQVSVEPWLVLTSATRASAGLWLAAAKTSGWVDVALAVKPSLLVCYGHTSDQSKTFVVTRCPHWRAPGTQCE